MKFTILIAAALAAFPSGAQDQPAKGVVRKNLAPVSSEVLRVKMPRPVERTLKNGLKVLIVENHRVPSVTFSLQLPASTLDDPEGRNGLAEMTAAMLRQGTAKRNARQIAESIAELGAGLNVMAQYGDRFTRVYGSALSENLDPLLDLTADILLHPAFPQDEIDKWKKRKLGELQQSRSSPNFLASERLYRALYAGDGRAVMSASPESVAHIGRDDLVAFHGKYYVPAGSLMGVTGDVTSDQIVARLEKYFADWKGGDAREPELALKPPLDGKKILLVNRPGSVQTVLALANRAIGRTSPDYIPAMVMNRVLGAGPASRLFINIREEKGFTYGVSSGFNAAKYLNHFVAQSSVRTEVTGPAIDEFLREFRRIRKEPVPREELELAKRAMVAGFALSIESQAGVLSQIMTRVEYGLPADYWDTYPEKVMAVTAAEVQRVARKYVPLDNVQLIAVGDGAKIREALARYGTVESYTSDGAPARDAR
jgi:zinc protease